MRAIRFPRVAVRCALAVLCAPSVGLCQIRDKALPASDAETPKPPSLEEQLFFRAANAERVARGLAAYKWNEALAAAARKHAALMAKLDELSHRLPGEPPLDERAAQAGARFSSVGENIAIGTDPPAIQNGWMHSPGHRENILHPEFTALGVGVLESNGEFYSVEDFATAVEPLTPEQQEDKLAELLKARGFRVRDARAEARKSCDEHFVPAHHSAMGILRLETPDLNKISEDMEKSLRGTKYRQAEIGACPVSTSEKGIARFRLVILLFPDSAKTPAN